MPRSGWACPEYLLGEWVFAGPLFQDCLPSPLALGPAANLLVAEVHPGRRGAALNLLNVSWSVGAVACPFLVAAAAKLHEIPLFLGRFLNCIHSVALRICAGGTARLAEAAAAFRNAAFNSKNTLSIGLKSGE